MKSLKLFGVFITAMILFSCQKEKSSPAKKEENKTIFLRLEAIDIDGTKSFSKTIPIN